MLLRLPQESTLLETAPQAAAQACIAEACIEPYYILQGNCTGDPASEADLLLAGPTLLPLKDQQCLLVVEEDAVDIGGSINIWLDNLYFRVRSSQPGNTPVVLTAHSSAAVWATHVTVQGDASPATQAVQASHARGIYASGAPHGVL